VKILYLSNIKIPPIFLPQDYLCDMVFHGFRALFGPDAVDIARNDSMYSDNPPERRATMYGRGFTIWNTLDPNLKIDRTDLKSKLKNKYFDLIVYGQATRCLSYLEEVYSHYPNNQVVLLDGEDQPGINPLLLRLGSPVFKRELRKNITGVFPISFCVPKEKLCNACPQKSQHVARTPTKSHVFAHEQEYYAEYRKSYFGLTHKKGGWDCCRHYEIIMNRCVPFFAGIQDIPALTMTHFPRLLVHEAMTLFDCKDLEKTKYRELEQKIFDHLEKHCITEAMAKYVLDVMRQYAACARSPGRPGRLALSMASTACCLKHFASAFISAICRVFKSIFM